MKLLHDKLLTVSVGKSRLDTNWLIKDMMWSDFAARCEQTKRTSETMKQYLAYGKDKQGEIKDVGGYVGGMVTGGRRKKGSILERSMLTLDVDFGTFDLWEDWLLLYGNAALIYTTHKHTPEFPRLRLVIPLNRTVGIDEYTAIARKVAGTLGIDKFDDTTFEPERLQYWPSTPKNGEYIFKINDAPFLDADKVLAAYKDWRDESQWPISSKVKERVRRNVKKQADPTTKSGTIGAFCKTYTITEAIDTFLSDEYEPTDDPDRYTFKEGTTAAGLIIYDDKWTYSHHGTDPTSGKLCNAFDLVRIHKFGNLDDDTKPQLNILKVPSFIAMTDYVNTLPDVRKKLGEEANARVREDFKNVNVAQYEDEVTPEEDPDDASWTEQLQTYKGKFLSTRQNILLILRNAPQIKNCFGFNSFEQREVALKNLPWRKIEHRRHYLKDSDDASIRHFLETYYGINGKDVVQDAISILMEERSFHPIKDYLRNLNWDGKPRIETMLVEYMGAEDTPYTRAVSRKMMAAAIARIYEPGTKFDYILVLVGKQGIQKSTFFKKLGRNWFTDGFSNVTGKESIEQVQGVWIVEIAELAALKKAEVEAVKHFISRDSDRYRVAFGRRVENFPRQCIFFGTTNNRDFLKDSTGNRRFWPVDTHQTKPVKTPSKDLSDYEIDQLWAEAKRIYQHGELLYLTQEMEIQAGIYQNDHLEIDDRTGAVLDYLDTLLPASWDEMKLDERRVWLHYDRDKEPGTRRRTQVCVAEIWCELLQGNLRDMNGNNTKYLHVIMQNLETWERAKSNRAFILYGLQKAYCKVPEAYGKRIISTA